MGKVQSYREIRRQADSLPPIRGVNHYRKMKDIYIKKGPQGVRDYIYAAHRWIELQQRKNPQIKDE